MAMHFIVLSTIGVFLMIVGITALAGNPKVSKNEAIACSLIGAFLFGFSFVGIWIAMNYAGEPIQKFHNGDEFTIVSFSPVADDNTRFMVGIRKDKDGRNKNVSGMWNALHSKDQHLRIYDIPVGSQIAQDLSSGKLKTPLKVEVRFINDLFLKDFPILSVRK